MKRNGPMPDVGFRMVSVFLRLRERFRHPKERLAEAGVERGRVVLASAGLNVVWGWQLRRAEGAGECRLARRVALVSGVAMTADWASGYYGFGSLMALLTGLWLIVTLPGARSQ